MRKMSEAKQEFELVKATLDYERLDFGESANDWQARENSAILGNRRENIALTQRKSRFAVRVG